MIILGKPFQHAALRHRLVPAQHAKPTSTRAKLASARTEYAHHRRADANLRDFSAVAVSASAAPSSETPNISPSAASAGKESAS